MSLRVFDIPCEWKLKTVEKISAHTLKEAESIAMGLEKPRWNVLDYQVEPVIGVIDYPRFMEMYPPTKPVDPMQGWTKQSGCGACARWSKYCGGYFLVVNLVEAPIDVGMQFPTYSWSFRKHCLKSGVCSMEEVSSLTEARDEILAEFKAATGLDA